MGLITGWWDALDVSCLNILTYLWFKFIHNGGTYAIIGISCTMAIFTGFSFKLITLMIPGIPG